MNLKLWMRVDHGTRIAALTVASCLILSVVLGCRKEKALQESQQPKVTYRSVANPLLEMCTDDSESRTEYFNVPVVRFEGSAIRLNGKSTSANDLQDWAMRKYRNLPEQAVWVQFLDVDEVSADQALLPIAMVLPSLQIRRADFSFYCPRLPSPR
jgi:hypothetical protein